MGLGAIVPERKSAQKQEKAVRWGPEFQTEQEFQITLSLMNVRPEYFTPQDQMALKREAGGRKTPGVRVSEGPEGRRCL